MKPRPRPFLTAPVPPGLAARRQETARAQAVGGRRQPGSGNKPGFKGDIRTAETLEEWKYTSKHSYALKRESLQELMEHALRVGCVPIFGIEFRDAMSKPSREQWLVIPAWVYADLTRVD